MFNSFLDGTKSAIEMAAVANATGLRAPDGLRSRPRGVDDLPTFWRAARRARVEVEVVSSLERDGSAVSAICAGASSSSSRPPTTTSPRALPTTALRTDASGRRAALYRPYHLIGLELGISVASVGAPRRATGCAASWRGDVGGRGQARPAPRARCSTARAASRVYGRLLPAHDSFALGALPIGLAAGARMTAPVVAGELVRRADVALDETRADVRLRAELEASYEEEEEG